MYLNNCWIAFFRFAHSQLWSYWPQLKTMESIDPRTDLIDQSKFQQLQSFLGSIQRPQEFRFTSTTIRVTSGMPDDSGREINTSRIMTILIMTQDSTVRSETVTKAVLMIFHYSAKAFRSTTSTWLSHHSLRWKSRRQGLSICLRNRGRHRGWRSWNVREYRTKDWGRSQPRLRSNNRCRWSHLPNRLSVGQQRCSRSPRCWTGSAEDTADHHQAFEPPRIAQMSRDEFIFKLYRPQ